MGTSGLSTNNIPIEPVLSDDLDGHERQNGGLSSFSHSSADVSLDKSRCDDCHELGKPLRRRFAWIFDDVDDVDDER